MVITCPIEKSSSSIAEGSIRWQLFPSPTSNGLAPPPINALSISRAVATRHHIVISPVVEYDSGRWVCESNTSLARYEFSLDVHRPPKLILSQTVSQPSPGQSMTLNCSLADSLGRSSSFDGRLSSTIGLIWLKDGRPLTFDGRVQKHSTSSGHVSFTISWWRYSDNGLYQCVLTKRDTSSSKKSFVSLSAKYHVGGDQIFWTHAEVYLSLQGKTRSLNGSV